MPLKINSAAGGSVTLDVGSTASTYTLTLPSLSGTVLTTDVSGNFVIASGNLNLSGTGQRITGDFSNATIANRLALQNSVTNGNTTVPILPNGTGTASGISFYNKSDPANAGVLNQFISSSAVVINSTYNGTGSYLPMTFYTGGSEVVRIDTSGNVGIGTTAPKSTLSINGPVSIAPSYGTYLVNSYYNSGWKYVGNGIAWGIGNNFSGPATATTIATASVNASGADAALTWVPALNVYTTGYVTNPYNPHVRVYAYTGSNFSLSAGDNGPLAFNTVVQQVGNNYTNTSGNYKFTCPVAGVYNITACVELAGSTAPYTNLQIRINGSTQAGTFQTGYNVSYQQVSTCAQIYCSASDYIQIYMYSNTASGYLEFSANDSRSLFTVTLIG